MIRRNPYYIQDNIRLDLRDSKGRYSPPSRAKTFYIYLDDDLVFSGEFPRVTLSVSEKEIIITDALNLILEGYLEDIVDREIVPEEIEYEEVEEVEEIEESEEPELSDLLYADLLELVGEEEKEELTDDLYRELLEVIAEDDPLLFEEITGVPLPVAGVIEEEYKEFQSYSLGGVTEEVIAMNQIFTYDLDRPITLTSQNPEIFIDIVKKNIIPAMKQVYDQRVEGLDLFLVSLIYTQNVEIDGQIVEVTKGISASRSQARNWAEFESLVIDTIYDHIRNSYKNYLSLSVDGALTTIGFRFENLFETSTGGI